MLRHGIARRRFQWRDRHRRAIELGVVTLLALSTWVVDRPGVFAVDSLRTWYEGHIGRFESGQPPALGLAWAALDKLGDGASSLVLLSCVSFCFGSYLIFRGASRPFVSLFYLFVVLVFPPVFAQLSIINKDTVGANILLLGFALFFYASRRGVLLLILSALACAAAVMLRYQYILSLAPMVLLSLVNPRPGDAPIGIRMKRGIQFSAALVFSCAVIFLAMTESAVVDWYAPFEVNWRLQQTYDLAALLAHGTRTPIEAFRELGVDGPRLIALAKRDYTPASNVPLFAEFDPSMRDVPTRIIARQVAILSGDNPGVLRRHRIATVAQFLGLGHVCWPVQQKIIRPPPGTPAGDLAAAVGLDRLTDSLASRYVLTARWFPANTFLFRPVLYLGLSLLLLGYLVASRDRRSQYFWMVSLLASAITYQLSFVPVVPSCDFRYSYWLVMTTSMCVCIVFCGRIGRWVKGRNRPATGSSQGPPQHIP